MLNGSTKNGRRRPRIPLQLLHLSRPSYIQSPSAASHADSSHSDRNPSSESAILSPFPHDNFNPSRNCEASHFTLSRYASRGSNNSTTRRSTSWKSGRLRIVEDVDHDDNGGVRRGGVWRFTALDPSPSCCWVTVHVFWRFLLSVSVALLVFFLLTKPPSPNISYKVVGFKQFSLGEGLDNTKVVTKILTINCPVNMVIDSNSKVFGLHIHPPALEMDFGPLELTQSQGSESNVESKSSYVLGLHVGVKDMPMYGAGRSMQDMLESGQGLPLMIRVRSRSSYRVVWNLIRFRYLHHGECLLVLDGAYDQRHRVHVRNSICFSSTYRK